MKSRLKGGDDRHGWAREDGAGWAGLFGDKRLKRWVEEEPKRTDVRGRGDGWGRPRQTTSYRGPGKRWRQLWDGHWEGWIGEGWRREGRISGRELQSPVMDRVDLLPSCTSLGQWHARGCSDKFWPQLWSKEFVVTQGSLQSPRILLQLCHSFCHTLIVTCITHGWAFKCKKKSLWSLVCAAAELILTCDTVEVLKLKDFPLTALTFSCEVWR